jgi:chromosome segregation ATPase
MSALNELRLVRVERERAEVESNNLQQRLYQMKEDFHLAEERLAEKTDALRAIARERDKAVTEAARYRDQVHSLAAEAEQNWRDSNTDDDTAKQRDEALQLLLATRTSLCAVEKELTSLKALLDIKENELSGMRDEKETLESKCRRLRECVLKMKSKVDEWQRFAEEQGRMLVKLKSAYDRTRNQAHEIARICQQRDQVSRHSSSDCCSCLNPF